MTSTPRDDEAVYLRRANPDDAETCHRIMWESVTDFGARRGTPLQGSVDDWWSGSEKFWRHLAGLPGEWWVAEDPDTGELIGYARSLRRLGLLELTEFFVLTGQQSRGVGRALLDRAFPARQDEARAIVATTDVRALTRYYGAGTFARFPILNLSGPPRKVAPTALNPLPIDDRLFGQVTEIEKAVISRPRPADELAWLLESREGWLYQNGALAVGYAFVGRGGTGPIAATDPIFLPDMLLHVEMRAQEMGLEKIDLEIPGVNQMAIRHLLGRGFRIDPWVNIFMTDRSFGQFDRYIGFSPPLFI